MPSFLKRISIAVMLVASIGVASALILNGGVAAPSKHASASLAGNQEVPPVKTHAKGTGAFVVYSNGIITGTVTTHGIHGTMAHIHLAAPGKNGPPIITLMSRPHGTWVIPSNSKLTPEQYKAFLAGDLYVNVHSRAHPGGEIRGQLTLAANHPGT